MLYIQNAAARVPTRTRKYDHISPVLRSLHWLHVAQRIDFKTVLLVYISDMFEPYEPTGTLRTSGRGLLLVPRVGLSDFIDTAIYIYRYFVSRQSIDFSAASIDLFIYLFLANFIERSDITLT